MRRLLEPPEWNERYEVRLEDMRLPEAGPKRHVFAGQVGADGFFLLDILAQLDALPAAATLLVVEMSRRAWNRHFERSDDKKDGRPRLRPVQGRDPGNRVEAPHDTEVLV